MISVKINSYSFKKEINSAILSQASMQNSEKKTKNSRLGSQINIPPAQEVRFDDAEQNQRNPKLNRTPSEPADQLNSLIS